MEVITVMIPVPRGFFEVQGKLVSADAVLFGQPCFGKVPEGFAVDVALATSSGLKRDLQPTRRLSQVSRLFY